MNGYYLAEFGSYDEQLGKNADGVQPRGNLHLSQPNIVDDEQKDIPFSIYYDSFGYSDGETSLGQWRHEYSKKMDATPNYESVPTKSTRYSSKEEACLEGWEEIKQTAYDGYYEMAQASLDQEHDLCTLTQNNKVVLQLPLWSNDETKTYHTITRPSGKTYVFSKDKHGVYRSLSGVNVQLEKKGNIWEFVDINDRIEHYNAKGQLVQQLSGQSKLFFTYNNIGKLTEIKNSFNHKVTLAYNDDKLATVQSSEGNLTTFFSYENDLLKEVGMDKGTIFTLSYNQNDQLNVQEFPLGNTALTFQYNQHKVSDFIVEATDGSFISQETKLRHEKGMQGQENLQGNTNTLFTFDRGVVKITKNSTPVETKTISYDDEGYVAGITVTEIDANTSSDIRANVYKAPKVDMRFSRNKKGQKTHVQLSMQGQTEEYSYEYQSKWNKPTKVIQKNKILTYEFNDEALPTHFDSFELNKDFNGTTHAARSFMVNKKSEDTMFEYDNRGLVTKMTLPDGSVKEFEYDALGKRSIKKGTARALWYHVDTAALPNIYDSNIKTIFVGGAGEGWLTNVMSNHFNNYYEGANKEYYVWWGMFDGVGGLDKWLNIANTAQTIDDGVKVLGSLASPGSLVLGAVAPIINTIKEYNSDLIVIGHSYGADSAIKFTTIYSILHGLVFHNVKLLITLDPVAWSPSYLGLAENWINVAADPGSVVNIGWGSARVDTWFGPIYIPYPYVYNHWNASDYIALAGGKITYALVGLSPFISRHMVYSGHHGDVSCMMATIAIDYPEIGLMKRNSTDTSTTTFTSGCGQTGKSPITFTVQ